MLYSHFIWDFKGTLLYDVPAGLKAVNQVLLHRNIPIITSHYFYRVLFKYPLEDFYKELGLNLEEESLEDILNEYRDYYIRYIKDCNLQEDVQNALEFFNLKGLKQIVVSSEKQEWLDERTDALCIKRYIDEVIGIDGMLSFCKEDLIRRWLKNNEFKRVLFIGDTTNDLAIAKRLNIDCMLIGHGHQDARTLAVTGKPTYRTMCEFVDEFIENYSKRGVALF